MKISKSKEKVLNILKEYNRPINVQSIYEKMLEDEKINLSTVYRCINSLCNENIILKEIRNDKVAYYTLNCNNHTHHLVCDVCNKTVSIDTCPITEISKQIKEKTGFNITNHSILLNGICNNCSKICK